MNADDLEKVSVSLDAAYDVQDQESSYANAVKGIAEAKEEPAATVAPFAFFEDDTRLPPGADWGDPPTEEECRAYWAAERAKKKAAEEAAAQPAQQAQQGAATQDAAANEPDSGAPLEERLEPAPKVTTQEQQEDEVAQTEQAEKPEPAAAEDQN